MVKAKAKPRRSKERARRATPEFVEPMKARETNELPDSAAWVYEIKWDGYRAFGLKDGATVRVLSRNNHELSHEFPEVAAALAGLRATSALIDGEIVSIGADGRPSFQGLQHRGAERGVIRFYAFDLLHLDGENLHARPLEERKAKLAEIVDGTAVMFSASLTGELDRIVEQVRAMRLEGIVAKRRDSTYESGERSGNWLKRRFSPEQEFVIGGYTRGSPLQSLVVGYYDGQRLISVGKVPGGLNPRNRRELFALLEPLWADVCPFANLPNSKAKSIFGGGITVEDMKKIQWVVPQFVAQVKFVEWTQGGNLRHASFQGLRHDKDPKEVVREIPAADDE